MFGNAYNESLNFEKVPWSEDYIIRTNFASGYDVLFDAKPLNPGHMLVVPRRLNPDRMLSSMRKAYEIADNMEKFGVLGACYTLLFEGGNPVNNYEAIKKFEDLWPSESIAPPDGINIGLNLGGAAGQTVMHPHVHVIPRYYGDTADPRGGIRLCIPERGNWKTSEVYDND